MSKFFIIRSFYVAVTSILVFLIAHFFTVYRKAHNFEQIVSSFQQIELLSQPKPVSKPGPLVLVGFGGCYDLALPALEFIKALNVEPPNSENLPNAPTEISTLNDVIMELAHSFMHGAAVERTVRSKDLFKYLLKIAKSEQLSKFKKDALGGNAPVMANRIASEGLQVALAGRLSKKIKDFIHSSIKTPPSFGLTDPPNSDIHLVLEFDKGETWGNFTSPRANRVIFIRDQENPRISGLWNGLMDSWSNENFDLSGRKNNKPDLFVIGGLQTMSNWISDDSIDIRGSRLDALHNLLVNYIPKTTLVHFEMASFDDLDLVSNLTRSVLPFVDSLGLNEQELPSLIEILRYGRISLEPSESIPRVATVLDQLRELWALLTDPDLPRVRLAQRVISRIHLHTLGFQIIIVRRNKKYLDHETRQRLMKEQFSEEGRLNHIQLTDIGRAWPRPKAAAAKASLTAYRYTCAEGTINKTKTKILMDDSFSVTSDRKRWPNAGKMMDQNLERIVFNSSDPVQCWFEQEPELPNLEEGTNRKPIGLKSNDPTSAHRMRTIQICVSTGLVCKEVRKTAGAGDNISAAALAVQTSIQNYSTET